MISEYRLTRRVQFYETDAAGIVHFSWFYRYMEEAEHALWREAGLTIAPRDAHIGFPRVSASFDFKRPLFFEDVFEVRLVIRDIARKTIRYEAEITSNGAQVAVGTLIVACVRKVAGEAMTAVPIPPEIVSRFRVFEEQGSSA